MRRVVWKCMKLWRTMPKTTACSSKTLHQFSKRCCRMAIKRVTAKAMMNWRTLHGIGSTWDATKAAAESYNLYSVLAPESYIYKFKYYSTSFLRSKWPLKNWYKTNHTKGNGMKKWRLLFGWGKMCILRDVTLKKIRIYTRGFIIRTLQQLNWGDVVSTDTLYCTFFEIQAALEDTPSFLPKTHA